MMTNCETYFTIAQLDPMAQVAIIIAGAAVVITFLIVMFK